MTLSPINFSPRFSAFDKFEREAVSLITGVVVTGGAFGGAMDGLKKVNTTTALSTKQVMEVSKDAAIGGGFGLGFVGVTALVAVLANKILKSFTLSTNSSN